MGTARPCARDGSPMVARARGRHRRAGHPVLALTACSVDGSDRGGQRPVATDVNDFTFESLDVEYELGRAEDGTSTLQVVETFVAVFPGVRPEPRACSGGSTSPISACR